MSKVVKTLKSAIQLCGLEDGMTISFHHNLRSGDRAAAQILAAIASLGIKDITIAPTSLLPGHDALIPYIEDGTITRIQTSGVTPQIGRLLQSRALLKQPVEMRTHGSRAAALESGEIWVNVAFVAASQADKYGGCNGCAGVSAFGSIGYSMVDVRYAEKVIVVTDQLLDEPVHPASIEQSSVNFVVPVESIGDPAGIATASLSPSRNPVDSLIADMTAQLIIHSGCLYDGCRMQTGAGKISLAVASKLSRYMEQEQITADFAMGGVTGAMVEMLEKGQIRALYDVQSFDGRAVRSVLDNDRHMEVSATAYASPSAKGGAIVDQLDFTILGATEIDTGFNVNVITDSNGCLISGTGGHGDSADGAQLTIITAPLYRMKYPTVTDRVSAICTPGRCVDAFVCEKGIAVNTEIEHNRELVFRLRDAGLPVRTIQDMKVEAERFTGKLPPLRQGGRTVAKVLWRDGTVLDEIGAYPE